MSLVCIGPSFRYFQLPPIQEKVYDLSRNDSSNHRALLETPGELDHEDTMDTVKDGVGKKRAIPDVLGVSVHRLLLAE